MRTAPYALSAFLCPFLSLLLPHSALAVPLDIDFNFTGNLTHTDVQFDLFDYAHKTKLEIALPPTVTTNLFTQNDGIRLSVSAPVGQRFYVTPGMGQTFLRFSANYQVSGGAFNSVNVASTTLQFLGVQGTEPSPYDFGGLSSTDYRTSGDQFVFDFLYEVTSPFYFTGWTATSGPFTNAPSLSKTYNLSASSSEIQAAYNSASAGPTAPLIELQAIPEVPSVLLIPLGMGVVFLLRSIRRPQPAKSS